MGNLFTLIIISSSKYMRSKTYNLFLISQSLLDLINSVLLIATAWDVMFLWSPGHNSIFGKSEVAIVFVDYQSRNLLHCEWCCRSHKMLPVGFQASVVDIFDVFHLQFGGSEYWEMVEYFTPRWVRNFRPCLEEVKSSVHLINSVKHKAVDCILVVHKTKFRKRHVLAMVIAAWLVGPTINLARYIPTTTVTDEGLCIQSQIWPNSFWNSFTSITICLVYFVIPLLVIVCLYFSIFIFLKRRAKSSSLNEGTDQSEVMNRAKANVLKTMILLSSLFVICWVWNTGNFFLATVGVNVSFTSPFYHFTLFMLNINCCVNPLCYAVQYREFQTQVRDLFCSQKQQADEKTSVASIATTETTQWKWLWSMWLVHCKSFHCCPVLFVWMGKRSLCFDPKHIVELRNVTCQNMPLSGQARFKTGRYRKQGIVLVFCMDTVIDVNDKQKTAHFQKFTSGNKKFWSHEFKETSNKMFSAVGCGLHVVRPLWINSAEMETPCKSTSGRSLAQIIPSWKVCWKSFVKCPPPTKVETSLKFSTK